jgi:SulP family sulfate permease
MGVVRGVMLGLIVGMDGIQAAVVVGALVFTGQIAAGMQLGVGAALLGAALSALVYAWRSTVPHGVTVIQESTIAVLAPAIAAMVATSQAPIDAKITTALAIVAIAGITTGTLFLLSGGLKLGGFGKYIPYPVLAGFIAGAGWLMVDASSVVLTGDHLPAGLIDIGEHPQQLVALTLTLGYVAALLLANRLSNSPLAIPGVMLSAIGAFFVVIWVAGISPDAARSLGQLPTSSNTQLQTVAEHSFSAVEWPAVLKAAPSILIVAVLSMVHLLLILRSVELATGEESDLNAELKANGLSNLASGCVGGPIVYTSLAMSTMATETATPKRVSALTAASLLLITMATAGHLLAYIPTFIPAGFILFLGITLLRKWLFNTFRWLPLPDFLISVTIVVSIAFMGFLDGLGVGLFLAVLAFVLTYARQPLIRLRATGKEQHSTVDRSVECSRFLASHGEQIEIIRLQGYLFFGTAERVVATIRERISNAQLQPLRFLILDFHHVSGADSTATASLIKIQRIVSDAGGELVLTRLPSSMKRSVPLVAAQLSSAPLQMATDPDTALAAAENALLREHATASSERTLADYFSTYVGDDPLIPEIVKSMSRLVLPENTVVVQHQADNYDLFFLESGRIRIQRTRPDGSILQIRSMMAGTLFGEIAFYLRQPRTADVITETASVVYRLRAADFEKLQEGNPRMAALLHRMLGVALAEKLSISSRALQSLDSQA